MWHVTAEYAAYITCKPLVLNCDLLYCTPPVLLMATQERLVIPHTAHSPNAFASSSLHTESSGSFRSSSEDTAVTIFSMYTEARDSWAANTKVLAMNDVDSVVRSRRSVDLSSAAQTWRGTADSPWKHSSASPARPNSSNGTRKRITKPPSSFQNSHLLLPDAADHRHSVASSSFRSSEDSLSLPYMRNSIPPEDKAPTPPPRSPFRPPSQPVAHLESPQLVPSLSLSPRPGPSTSTSPNPSFVTERSEGEDPDAFHIRSTYAQLDAEGVVGDGYEEGVELTRAKQGGTTYLMSHPNDRRRASDLSPKELAVLASVDRFVAITLYTAYLYNLSPDMASSWCPQLPVIVFFSCQPPHSSNHYPLSRRRRHPSRLQYLHHSLLFHQLSFRAWHVIRNSAVLPNGVACLSLNRGMEVGTC